MWVIIQKVCNYPKSLKLAINCNKWHWTRDKRRQKRQETSDKWNAFVSLAFVSLVLLVIPLRIPVLGVWWFDMFSFLWHAALVRREQISSGDWCHRPRPSTWCNSFWQVGREPNHGLGCWSHRSRPWPDRVIYICTAFLINIAHIIKYVLVFIMPLPD